MDDAKFKQLAVAMHEASRAVVEAREGIKVAQDRFEQANKQQEVAASTMKEFINAQIEAIGL